MTDPTRSAGGAPVAQHAIELRDVPAQDYLGKRFTCSPATVGENVQKAMREIYECIQAAHSSPSGPPFLTATPPRNDSMEVEVGGPCVPVPTPPAGLHAGKVVASPSAVLVYRGPYDKLAPAYGEIFEWIARHGYRPAGPPREVYLNGPDEVASPADLITEIVAPIAR